MENIDKKYVRRSQKDYTMTFKLSVVREYETSGVSYRSLQRKYGIQGGQTVADWVEKYGNFDHQNKSNRTMEKSYEQKMMELDQKVKLLDCQKARLEEELNRKDLKAGFFDLMIDLAEKEYNIDIRKKCLPRQSKNIEG